MVNGKSRRKSTGDNPNISGQRQWSKIFSFGRDNAGFESDPHGKKPHSKKDKDFPNVKAMMSTEFRHWATDNAINTNTLAMLALEHFDSMATISMLRPDMVAMMGLSEDESKHLTQAIKSMQKPPPPTPPPVPMFPPSLGLPLSIKPEQQDNSDTDEKDNSKNEKPIKAAEQRSRRISFDISATAQLLSQLHVIERNDDSVSKTAHNSEVTTTRDVTKQEQDQSPQEEHKHMNKQTQLPRGAPVNPVAHLVSHLHRVENNNEGLFKFPPLLPPIQEEVKQSQEQEYSNFPSVHSLKRDEIDALLNKLLLDDVISVDIHEDIKSEYSLVARAGCLEIIILSLNTQRRNTIQQWLEKYKAEHDQPVNDDVTNIVQIERSQNKCRVVNSKDGASSFGKSLEKTEKAQLLSKDSDEEELRRKIKSKNKEVLLDISKFAVSDKRLCKQSAANLENEDSVMDETPCVCELQYKFGTKGRGHGQLEDATSISALGQQVFVTDVVNNRLQIFSMDGQPLGPFVLEDFSQPWNSATTRSGQQNLIAVTFKQSSSVVLMSENYQVLGAIRDDTLKSPCGLAFDNKGKLIVSDISTNRVHIFDLQSGKRIELNTKIEFNQPSYVTVSPFDDIIISDTGNQCVKIFSSDGEFVRKFGALGREHGEFRCPYGLCTDSRGCILVTDHYNNRICKFSRGGQFLSELVTDDHGLVRPKDVLMTSDHELFVNHGGMKASEILKFQIYKETPLCWI